MLRHYRDLVDDIFLIVHSIGENDPIRERVRAVADELGCQIHRSVVADRFDPAYATQLYNEAMQQRPDDWWIVADPDELHLYFKDLREILRECEANGWTFVGGHFLDRFGPGGTLPTLDDSDIWHQFPVAGVARSILTSGGRGGISGAWAPSWKVCVAKGTVRLGAGQHCVLTEGNVSGYPIPLGLVQVHHFKWDSTVLSRHLDTLETIKRAERPGESDSTRSYQTMYDYLVAHDGRVDISDPRCLFAECPEPVFSAYPYWSEIVRHRPPFGLELDPTSWKSMTAFHLWKRPVLGQLFWWMCRFAGQT